MSALAQSREVLELLSKTLGFVPIIGESLKSAAELASKICEEIQAIQENREGYERLGVKVKNLLFAVSSIVDKEKDRKDTLSAREPHVENLLKVLEEISAAVHERVASRPPAPAKKLSRFLSGAKRTLTDTKRMSADKQNIQNMDRKLQDVLSQFGISALVQIEGNVQRVLDSMSLFAAAQHAEGERARKALKNADLGKEVLAPGVAVPQAIAALLDTLEPVKTVLWTTLPRCTPDTRVSVLHNIETWVGSSNGPCVFWLNGLAGTGKSTIAATVCERLDEKQLLGASFFISRQQADSREAAGIVRSIAHGLASRNGLIAEALCTTLRDSSASVPRSLQKQIAEFVVAPARELDAQSTLVIVIDALDECVLDERGRPGGDLLPSLVRQLLNSSGRLKLFITSRNERPIQQMFDGLYADAQQQVTQLHNLDRVTVTTDIETYLRQSFDTIRNDRSSELPVSGWPEHDDLHRLVRLSGLLFVYAATAVRFLYSRKHNPVDRLAQLLEQQEMGDSVSTHKDLDKLYTRIVRNAVETLEGEEDLGLCRRLHNVVAVIVLAQTPVHIDALAVLSGVKLSDVRIVLDWLASLLLVDTDEPVRIFHLSFPDFMVNAGRCTMESIRVNPRIDHGELALRALMILNETLHYDMCDIRNPAMANRDVPDLAGRLRQKVPCWNAVRYTSCFWMNHVVECEKPGSELVNALNEFCHKHLFHWLEVLSLAEYLSSLESELLRVVEWCKTHAPDTTNHVFPAADLLSDTVRTLEVYYIPIRSHALQVYHSAFVTMPMCSLQQTLAEGDLPSSLLSLVSPRASHWGPSTRILEGHRGAVSCVVFAPNGTRIASCSDDETMRIWDAVTFVELAKLEGHHHRIDSVVFSPDGTRIASGSNDKIVRLWDADTFEELVKLKGHESGIMSVAFSPDSTRIASGSLDGTVRIWNAVTFEELAKLDSHEDMIRSVVFSPDGTRIAFGPNDGTVFIRNAITFEELAKLEGCQRDIDFENELSPDGVCIAFSPDGTRIASGSNDYAVRIWNAITFEELAKLVSYQGAIRSVAFSPDGTSIASGLSENTVCIWNAVTSEELAKLEGHQGWVSSVVFSSDGTHIASGSSDCTVRIWNAVKFEKLAKLEGHQDCVRSVVFSLNGTRISSGSDDKTVRIWNAITFEELAKLEGHQDWVRSVVSSPDGTYIASGSDDKTVRIWNAVTFEEVARLEGHRNKVNSVVFSPDGTRIASGSDDETVRIWNAVTSEKLAKLKGHEDAITSVDFSPDGTRIASGSKDGTVRIWNAVTFEELAKLEGHQDWVCCVAFSSDGARIASGSDDKTVRIWNTVTFEELVKLEGHQDWVNSVAFSPDGTIVSCCRSAGGRYAWTCNGSTNDMWAEVSPATPHAMHDDDLGFPELTLTDSGWLDSGVVSHELVLWLPVDRRGPNACVASFGPRVVVGAETGPVTILELPARSASAT